MPLSNAVHIVQTAKYHLQMLISSLDQLEEALGSSIGSSNRPDAVPDRKPRRKLSAAGRKRIAEASKKRWAAVRAAADSAKKSPAKKASVKKASVKKT